MARIEACAIIATAERADRIDSMDYEEIEYRADNGLQLMPFMNQGEAVAYVIGSIKAMFRTGQARNYAEGVEIIENRQAGDRETMAIHVSDIDRDVRRINRINKVSGTHRNVHKRNMAKVMGSLYVQWEAAEDDAAVDRVYVKNEINAIIESGNVAEEIARYMADYVSRLSNKARESLNEVIAARYSVGEITRKQGEALRVYNKAYYLYKGFPARDSVTLGEFVELVRGGSVGSVGSGDDITIGEYIAARAV